MEEIQYFRELAIHLAREEFTVQKEEDGLLPVELDGALHQKDMGLKPILQPTSDETDLSTRTL